MHREDEELDRCEETKGKSVGRKGEEVEKEEQSDRKNAREKGGEFLFFNNIKFQ